MVTCDEFNEMVWAYALGALSPEETEACRQHLAGGSAHTGCLDKLAQAREALVLWVDSLPQVTPGPEGWAKLDARLAADPRLRSVKQRRRREGLAWGVALAATLVAVTVSFLGQRTTAELVAARHALTSRATEAEAASVTAQNDKAERERCRRELEGVEQRLAAQDKALSLLQDPSTRLVALRHPESDTDGGQAVVNFGKKSGVVLASTLAPQAGKDYQLWFVRGATKTSAGLLLADAQGAAVLDLAEVLKGEPVPDVLAVTLEPAGGVTQPTGPMVLVGKVKRG